MKPEWKNEHVEAWRLDDGTLVVRRRINEPREGFDHYFLIDTLPPVAA